MNIDKYIEAQSKISKIADSSTTSGFGLSPALANIIIDGKSDSGSQMLYALKIFYGADTQIPEDIALEAINDAIRINFPNKKGIFLGIYRKAINKEDNISAEDRTTNNMKIHSLRRMESILMMCSYLLTMRLMPSYTDSLIV